MTRVGGTFVTSTSVAEVVPAADVAEKTTTLPDAPSPAVNAAMSGARRGRITTASQLASAAQDLFARAGNMAVRGALIGALGFTMVGCSTLEIEVPVHDGGTERVELRTPVPHFVASHRSNGPRTARFEAILDRLAQEDPRLAPPPLVREALVYGVNQPRAGATRGYEGVLGVRDAIASARAFARLPRAAQRRVQDALSRAGTGGHREADAMRERALVMSALGARGPREVDAVLAFAERIRGMHAGDLVRRTTLIDIHDQNLVHHDPDRLQGPATDRFGDNDGLYQRFVNTCVPSVAQMMRGERDPIYAFEVNATMTRPDPFAGGGAEQAAVLEAHSSAVVSRLGAQQPPLFLDLDVLADALPDSLRDPFLAYAIGRPADDAQYAQVRTAVAHLNAHGHAVELSDLESMRAQRIIPSAGMLFTDGLPAVLGGRVEEKLFEGRSSLREMIRGLELGDDYVIRVASRAGGHAMLVSDVRGAQGRSFLLVSDPWEGRTAWVSEQDFRSGRFLYTTFRLGHDAVTHYYPWSP